MAGAFSRFAVWLSQGDNAFGILLWATMPLLTAIVVGGFF